MKKIQGFFSCLNRGEEEKGEDEEGDIITGLGLSWSIFGALEEEDRASQSEALRVFGKRSYYIKDIVERESSSGGLSCKNTVVKELSSGAGLPSTKIAINQLSTSGGLSCKKPIINQFSSGGGFPTANTVPDGEDTVIVGFETEAMMMKERLTGGDKELEIISIVGMPGLGKTTLSRKVYRDPLTIYHFQIRAWITVSQEYETRDLLLGLLSSVTLHTEEILEMSNENLSGKLYKLLKGKRYLIVMDDVWNIRVWDDLKGYFPNDYNGSRIIFTSQLVEVPLHAKPKSDPHFLRFLTEDESWELFERKVFRSDICPPELMGIGREMVKRCRGLPLAIVVVAGILASKREKRKDEWMQVLENIISSCIVGDSQLCTETLALSYNHLPQHLKPCLLYFGAFWENLRIPARKLIMLWIGEGFIEDETGERSLEDVAEGYLLDLISRSLVMVTKRRSDGGVKACGIHDLLRDFCIRKAEEEYFLKQISDRQFFSYPCSVKFSKMSRLCIDSSILKNTTSIPSSLRTRSLLCITSGYTGSPPPKFLSRCFKVLTVLDMSCILISRYPSEIEQLVLLRFLALGKFLSHVMCCLPASFSNLRNLETFVLSSSFSSVMLPHSVWEMMKLRHLCYSGPRSCMIERCSDNSCCHHLSLDSLQTISGADSFSWCNFLAETPNLRKLGLRGLLTARGCLRFPDIYFLNLLQKLKLSNTGNRSYGHWTQLGRTTFPPNLKKLTLENTYLKWDEMSSLGKLVPNLEVLKLLSGACIGECWTTSEGDFPRLTFLKLKSVQITQWEVSSFHFPSLDRLAVVECHGLERIPSEIGYIPTLHVIEVHWCNPSISNSAKEIKVEQESMGNNWLQIFYSNMVGRTAEAEGNASTP